MQGPGRTKPAYNQPPFLVIEKIPQGISTRNNLTSLFLPYISLFHPHNSLSPSSTPTYLSSPFTSLSFSLTSLFHLTESCTMEKLNEWFKRFGTIVNIQLDLDALRAVIQFTHFEEAKAAFSSPEAVFGNRFVKVYWHRVDDIPKSNFGPAHSAPSTPSTTNTPEKRLPPPNTPMKLDHVADRERERQAILADVAQKKQDLVQRQIEHQKALLKRLESPDLTSAEREEIRLGIRSIEESTRSILAESAASVAPPTTTTDSSGVQDMEGQTSADPDLVSRLDALKEQVRRFRWPFTCFLSRP